MSNGYISIERDNQIIQAGGFFCGACLKGKPLDDISHDPRYCQGCYEFLTAEAGMLPATQRPSWRPSPSKKGQEKPIPVSQDVVSIMATVKDKKFTVAIIYPPVDKGTREKRGPKHKPLPEELITQWASEGMGYKRIAARLKGELGIVVGFRTIARVITGERQHLELPMKEKEKQNDHRNQSNRRSSKRVASARQASRTPPVPQGIQVL